MKDKTNGADAPGFTVHNPHESPNMADPGRPYVDGKPVDPAAPTPGAAPRKARQTGQRKDAK